MSTVRTLIAALAAALVIAAPASAAAPKLVGVTPVDVSPTAVRLAILLDTGGYPGTFKVEYGETTTYAASTADADLPADGSQVTARLTSLTAATTYHFRVTAITSEGTIVGPDETVTTSVAGAPSLVARPWVGRQASGAFQCDPGSWTAASSFAYQWLRDGKPITGAIAQTYGATSDDHNHALACRVTASDADRTSFAISDGVAILPAPAALSRPAIVSPPGSAYAGASIVCDPGRWTVAASFTYAWQRDGVAIPGATNAVYPVTKEDEGHALACRVLATANNATTEAFSDVLAVRTAVVSCVTCAASSTALPTAQVVAKAVKALAGAFASRNARTRLLRRGSVAMPFALGQPGWVTVEWTLGSRAGGVVIARAAAVLQRGKTAAVRIRLVRGAKAIFRRAGRLPVYAVATFGPTDTGSYSVARRVRK